MSPTIRVDDEVLDALKQNAEPFVDTPNSVLRRILGLAAEGGSLDPKVPEQRRTRGRRQARRTAAKRSAGSRKGLTRAPAGSMLPDSEYETPILEILREKGGRAPTREVIDTLGGRLDGRLTDIDRQPLRSGDIRWRNRAQFVRLNLIQQGDMLKGSPRGVWEISDQGLARVAAHVD
jgi:Mrr N-terminal domain